MRALIVDDEQDARDAIQLLTDWKQFGIDEVVEAENVEQAIEQLISSRPEIIFTDMMMPKRDGIDLLSWVEAHDLNSKVIVISAHKDFHYVQNTIRYGGVDYLIKPIDPDDLNDVVSKAVSQLKTEREAQHYFEQQMLRWNKVRSMYWDQLFSRILLGDYRAEDDRELMSEFSFSILPKEAQIAIIDLQWFNPSVKRKFANNPELYSFFFLNVTNEYLLKERAGYAFREIHQNKIVMIIWKVVSSFTILEEINRRIIRVLYSPVHFGFGDVTSFPKGLSQSFHQAEATLLHRDLTNNSQYIHTHREKNKYGRISFKGDENKLELAILSGRRENVNQAVVEWIEDLRGLPFISLCMYEKWKQDFFSFAESFYTTHIDASNSFPTFSIDLPINKNGNFSFSIWERQILMILLEVQKDYLEKRDKEQVSLKIAQYIDDNYMEYLSLSNLAQTFSFSPEHLSRKFKQELNITISDYIIQKRINHAKSLLINTNLKIQEIANMVGYEDKKYFSKAFKKCEGVTPANFRQNR
ncbi:response regulator transcription factor [Lederbergia ruris]|uniref:response regulator transcription factor n=1 Tax=Lederbergia ruris TaxID=217495 RepID=UPI0039A3B553